LQVVSVVLLTIGVIIAAWSDAQTKVKRTNEHEVIGN